MADATYQPKTYRKDGGDTHVIASGGVLDVESGGAFKLAGVAITPTAAELNKAASIAATAYQTVTAEVLFTEAGVAGVYTGTIALPAGSRIIDVGVDGIALWTAGTTAAIIVGDDDDDNGFFTSTNLLATDLLEGEINNIEHPGGKAGAYIASEARILYAAAARNVIGVVTTTGTTAETGITRMYVVYANPTAGAATKVNT